MNQPFFIACLPRSRSAWLANLLTTDRTFCLHESAVNGRHLSELFKNVPHGTKICGDADPAIGLFWRELLEVFPKSRVVFVLRNKSEAARAEFEAICEDGNLVFDGVTLQTVQTGVDAIQDGLDHLWKALPRAQKICVGYDMLDDAKVIEDIWNFCLPGIPFQAERYRMLDNLRVTQIFSKVLNKSKVNREAILARISANSGR